MLQTLVVLFLLKAGSALPQSDPIERNRWSANEIANVSPAWSPEAAADKAAPGRVAASATVSLLGTVGLGIAGWSIGYRMCKAAGYPPDRRFVWSNPCFSGGTEGVLGMLVGMSLGAGAGAWAGSQLSGGRPHVLGSLGGGLGGTLVSALIVGLGSAVIPPDNGIVIPLALLALLVPPVGATWATEYSHRRMVQPRGSAVTYGVTFAPRPQGGLVSLAGAF